MTEPGRIVTPSGVVLTAGTPTAGLLAAIVLPHGGSLTVDLLRPAFPYALAFGPQDLADRLLADLANAMSRSMTDPSEALPVLPAALARRAITAGVDRWSVGELDENLLTADRALSLVEAGERDAAGDLFRSASDRLGSFLAEQLDFDDERPTAVVAELRTVLRAAAPYSRELDDLLAETRRLRQRRGPGTSASVLERRPLAHAESGQVDVSLTVPGMPLVVLDPLRVPARLVQGAPVVRRQDDRWHVRSTAAPGVRAGHPAARRLFVRAINRRTGDVVALGPFELEGPEFAAALHVPAVDAADLVIDIYDVLAPGEPRHDPADSRDVDTLRRVQLAFSLARDAAALYALGAPDEAVTGLRLAEISLADADDPDGPIGEYARSLDATVSMIRLKNLPASARAIRPLLSELAQRLHRSP